MLGQTMPVISIMWAAGLIIIIASSQTAAAYFMAAPFSSSQDAGPLFQRRC